MVVFDIMASHFNMMRWHEAGLTQHKADLAIIQAAKLACKQQLLQQSSQQAPVMGQTNSQRQILIAPAASELGGSQASGILPEGQTGADHVLPSQPVLQQISSLQSSHSTNGTHAATQLGMESAVDQLTAGIAHTPKSRKEGLVSAVDSSKGSYSCEQTSAADSPGAGDSPTAGVEPGKTPSANDPEVARTPRQSTPIASPKAPNSQAQHSPVADTAANNQSASDSQPFQQTAVGQDFGEVHQQAGAQPKMSVRFDSQTPASPPPAAVAASCQRHVPHTSMHLRAHALGDKTQTGQEADIRPDKLDQWRTELEVMQGILSIAGSTV